MMKVFFLGTGTSTGIPQIACKCEVCVSNNAKDKRLRSSILININDTKILIDSGPDLRQQLLREKVDNLSAVLITHQHYDHIGGLDDIRPLGNTDIYGEKKVLKTIEQNMPYCFSENTYPGVPRINLKEIDEKPFSINELKIEPIRIMHANLPIFGFKICNFAYVTDAKTISEDAISKLKGVDTLIINALRKTTHISHLALGEAIQIANEIGARVTYLTHISHDMGLHERVNESLPENISLAYDGLEIIISN